MQFSSQFLWLRRQGTTRKEKEHVRRPYSGAMVTIFSQLDIFISKLLGNVNKQSGSTGDSNSVRKHFHCTKTLFECLFEYCLDVFVGHLLVSFLELVRFSLVVFFAICNKLFTRYMDRRTDRRTDIQFIQFKWIQPTRNVMVNEYVTWKIFTNCMEWNYFCCCYFLKLHLLTTLLTCLPTRNGPIQFIHKYEYGSK